MSLHSTNSSNSSNSSNSGSSHNSSVDPKEIAKFNRLAQQWWEPDGPLKTLHDINPCRLAWIEQCMDLKAATVLDVGCGGGILAESMAKKQAIVTGLDADSHSIQIAREHALRSSLAIEYHDIAIENFSGGPYDAVTCLELLEHVTCPQTVIQHCARLLKPGGYLFLSTLNRTVKSYFSAVIAAEYLLQLLPKQTHDYQRFIKPSELAAMVRKSDLEVLDIKGMDYHPVRRTASLQASVSVNYLMVGFKPCL